MIADGVYVPTALSAAAHVGIQLLALSAQRVRAAAAAGRVEVQEAGAGSPSWVGWRRGSWAAGSGRQWPSWASR